MLQASLGFFILALIAILFGATSFAGISMEIGGLLLGVFLILSVLTLIIGVVRKKSNGNYLNHLK